MEPTKNCSLPVPSPGSPSLASQNRCVDAAEACTADTRCQRLRTEYVAQCLGPAPPGGCHRARCRRALRRFFARGPPAITHALLFCPCGSPECAERRRQTFVPACAFSGPGPAPPSCLAPLDACEHSPVCRCGREPGKKGAGRAGRGGAASRLPPSPPHRAGPASWPSRLSARLPPAPPTAARQTRLLAACAPTRASWVRAVGIRARAGFFRVGPAWVVRLLRSLGLRRHRGHPQLPEQRERACGALVRLRRQRKPAGGVRSFPGALYEEPLFG